jgi:hypothetical protein
MWVVARRGGWRSGVGVVVLLLFDWGGCFAFDEMSLVIVMLRRVGCTGLDGICWFWMRLPLCTPFGLPR